MFVGTIPDLEVEILSWTLSLSAPETPIEFAINATSDKTAEGAAGTSAFFDQAVGGVVEAQVVARDSLADERRVDGPARVEEAQTTTVVPTGFSAALTRHGHLALSRVSA